MVSTINIADAAAATASKTAAVALTASGKPKEKRRNNEKRKEKSRDAARCRRSRETEIFTQLAQVLPLKEEDVNQLDKASVMRIAIAYLKVREMLQLFPKIQELTGEIKIDTDEDDDSKAKTKTDINNFDLLNSAEASHLMKQTLDGFLIILSNDGDITYVSDNITDYLGIAKIDILGQQIWEYSHQCDHAELKEALNIKRNGLADKVKDEHLLEEGLSTDRRDLFVRLKCTLTSRGRSINIKSASYKVIHVTGHLVVNTKGDRVLVAIGRPIPHPSNIEIPLGTTTFLTKHSLDMKFTYVDDKMSSLFGYKPEDLLEKSLFDCHHGADSDSLMATFKTVLGKGQGETCRYRFLGKCGGYCWIVTQATILYDKMKPQSVVCVNYVISQLENDHEIYSLAQYEASQQQKLEDSSNNNTSTTITDCKESNTIASNSNNKKKLPIDNNQPEESAIASIATTATIINNKNNNNTINKININNNSNKFNISNNNKININNNNCNKTKKFNIIGEENGEVAAVKPSPTVAAAATIITTTQKTPSPVTPTTIADDDNNILPVVKREQTSPAASPPLKPIEIDIDVDNKSSPLTPIVKREGSAAHSQLPLCRSLQTSSSLGPSKAKLPALLPPPVAKPGNEKRPKSVTASVFRVAPTALNHSHDNQSLQQQQQQHQPTTSGGQTIFLNPSQLPQLNAAPRAQSVTASVFTPISQLPNKQQQHIAKASTAAILGNHHQQQQQQSSSLLARAEDMNKGFLSFAEDATELRMLKEEPDDLAHLAPNTVDACIPLDDATPLFSEMLVGLMPYGSLLPDDINSLDSTTSSSTTTTATTTAASSSTVGCGRNQHGQNYSNDSHTNGRGGSLLSHSHSNNNNNNHNNHNNNSNHSNNNNGQITTSSLSSSSVSAASPAGSTGGEKEGLLPFINYREESNDTNCSQHLLSPSVTSKSPEASSLPSLCSPNSLSQEDEFAFMTMNVDDDIDLTMRAPYIPMNEQDDLPLLTDDLMWCGASAFPAEELNMHKDSDVLQYDVLKQQLQLQQQLQQQQQQQQQQLCGNRTLLSYQLHQQQQELSQQHFNNSLCSSPASTASSLSPSPVNHHHNHHQQQQQQQQQSGSVFTTDSSELAALLCGSGNGSLSILSNHGGSGSGCAEDSDSGIGIGGVNGAMSPGSSHHQQHSTSLDADDFRLHSLQQQLHEHHQHQQQQQQQHNQHQQQLLGLDIDCKKEKFESGTAGLCESIEDAFEHVYSKDSPNLDCWNELLQINVNDTSSSSAATTPPPTSLSPTSQQQQQQQSLEQQQQQQQDCKQHIQLQQLQSTNIILNATATAATLHVPLITIQTNKNLLLQQQQQQQQQQQPTLQRGNNNKLVLNDEMLSGRSIGGGNNNSKKLTTIKLVNASSVAPNAATTATATIRIADNRDSNSNNTTTSKAATKATAQQQQHGNKRHLSATSAASQQVDAKRLKNSNATTIELLTTPHLLQQLTSSSSSSSSASAATSASLQQAANNRAEQKQQQQQQQQRKVAAVGQRWASQQQQQQQQQSNSVLKNLLISGCDDPVVTTPTSVAFGHILTKSEPMMTDENSMDQTPPVTPPPPMCLSPSLTEPLSIATSPSSVLRNCRNNPMIGGPGVLPSPLFATDSGVAVGLGSVGLCSAGSDDSNPPGLTSCDTDSASDSGIDDISVVNESATAAASPVKLENANGADDLPMLGAKSGLLMRSLAVRGRNDDTPSPSPTEILAAHLPKYTSSSSGRGPRGSNGSGGDRKTSISFMDSSNPLLTPFLMDLCNDDYNMSAEEFLEGDDIEHVLNQWTSEMV